VRSNAAHLQEQGAALIKGISDCVAGCHPGTQLIKSLKVSSYFFSFQVLYDEVKLAVENILELLHHDFLKIELRQEK
jgi:hypothetical protein